MSREAPRYTLPGVTRGLSLLVALMGSKKPKPKSKAEKLDERQRALSLALPGLPTLAELVKWHADTLLSRLRPGSRRTLRSLYRIAVAELPPRPTGGEVAAWLTRKVEAGEWSRTTANLARKALYRLYKSARDLRWPMLLNVIAEVPPFVEAAPPPRVLPNPEETFERFLLACNDDTERAMLHVLRDLGLRIGEVLGLEPHHLSVASDDGATISLMQQRDASLSKPADLKTRAAAATMAVSPELAALLRRVLRARQSPAEGAHRKPGKLARYVFPFRKTHLAQLLARLRAAVPGALPPGLGWHAFRHTLATEMVLEAGRPVEDVMGVLRHSQMAHTVGYVATIRAREVPKDALQAVWAARAAKRANAAKLSGGIGLTVGQSETL